MKKKRRPRGPGYDGWSVGLMCKTLNPRKFMHAVDVVETGGRHKVVPLCGCKDVLATDGDLLPPLPALTGDSGAPLEACRECLDAALGLANEALAFAAKLDYSNPWDGILPPSYPLSSEEAYDVDYGDGRLSPLDARDGETAKEAAARFPGASGIRRCRTSGNRG